MIIATQADLEEGVTALIGLESRFGPVVERLGTIPLRIEPSGLASLLAIITEQSVSLKAATSIRRRLDEAFDAGDAEAVLGVSVERLRALGLTRSKGRAFHAAAAAARDGLLESLLTLGDDDAKKALTALHGIGEWTAQTYLLSCLGRSDSWPAGDVALQAAAADLFSIDPRPDVRQMVALAEPWRPWRAVAARILWTWYRSGIGADGLRHTPQAVRGQVLLKTVENASDNSETVPDQSGVDLDQ